MGIETLAMVSIASSIAAGVVGAAGAVMQGQAAANAANYRAAVAQQQAKRAREVGERQAQAQAMKTASTLGQQTAAQAGSGVAVNVGSPVDIRSSAATLGRLDEQTIRSTAADREWGYQTEASLQRFAADNAETAGYLGAGTSILGAASSVSDKWLSYRRFGVQGFNEGQSFGRGGYFG